MVGVALAKPWLGRPRVRLTVSASLSTPQPSCTRATHLATNLLWLQLKPLDEESGVARFLQKVLVVPTHCQVEPRLASLANTASTSWLVYTIELCGQKYLWTAAQAVTVVGRRSVLSAQSWNGDGCVCK